MRAKAQLGCGLLVLACACGDGGALDGERGRHGNSSVGGQVVSTVDGAPITLAEVRALIGAGEIDPRTALRRLQDERVLAHEAARRELGVEWSVADVERRAAVQALLAHAARAAVVPQEPLEAAYAAQGERFDKPEQRASVHLLASIKADADPAADAAARAAVERLIPMLAGAEDLAGFVQTYASVKVDGVSIICERLPALPLKGRLVQPYADALFSVSAPGMVPGGAVRTSFGWHVIRVTEIQPALHTPREEALAALREELLLEVRKQAVTELLAQLSRKYPVQLSENATKSMASLSFNGAAPASD